MVNVLYHQAWGKILLLKKYFPAKVHDRGCIILTLMVTTDSHFTNGMLYDSYSNIPVYLYITVENSKKLILVIAKEQIYTHSNHLTNNLSVCCKPFVHNTAGLRGYASVLKNSRIHDTQSSLRRRAPTET